MRDSLGVGIARETAELATSLDAELHELAAIHQHRGLDKDLAMTVAKQLTAHDRLGALATAITAGIGRLLGIVGI